MIPTVIRSGRRQDLARLLESSSANTVAVQGEPVLVQRLRCGATVETTIRPLRQAPSGAVEGSVTWDARLGGYRVVHGGRECSAALPVPVVTAATRIVRVGGLATLSGQAVTFGPATRG